jgi:hypothetical protein
MSHPDPLDRLCSDPALLCISTVIEIRNAAELRGNADLVRRCDAVLETLAWSSRQERGLVA